MIEIRFAGFGGQGVLTTGMVCATAGMDLGKNGYLVSFIRFADERRYS